MRISVVTSEHYISNKVFVSRQHMMGLWIRLCNIVSGNTLFDPKFKDGEQLRTYDYVVANPPFSDKTWSTGLSLGDSGKGDKYQRFTWGVPPKRMRKAKSRPLEACIAALKL